MSTDRLSVVVPVTWLGLLPCHTPVCGFTDRQHVETMLSDVFRIGRQVRLICQRCGRASSVSENELKGIITPDPGVAVAPPPQVVGSLAPHGIGVDSIRDAQQQAEALRAVAPQERT